jgi:hypothetical protein
MSGNAPAATAPNSAAPRAGICVESGTCTGRPLVSASSCMSSGLRSAIPPQATISRSASPCSAKLSMIRRLPNAIDSSSAR